MEEWNEHIEEIIQNKSFEDLTPEDIEVLGEIASDAKSYESYRQLLNNVIPAVKQDRIQPSPGLDEKIRSITEKEGKKGGGYFNWVKYAAAAAILIGVFSVSYWFIENNKVQNDAKVAKADQKEKMPDKKEESKASDDQSRAADSSYTSGMKDASPTESETEEIKTLNNQNKMERDVAQEKGVESKNSTTGADPEVLDEVVSLEDQAYDDYRNRKETQVDDFEQEAETVEHADEEVAVTAPSVEGALRESTMKNKRSADSDHLSDDDALFSTSVKTERTNSGGVYANAPKEDDVRDDIVGTIELAKPASSQEDAFDLLTIAF